MPATQRLTTSSPIHKPKYDLDRGPVPTSCSTADSLIAEQFRQALRTAAYMPLRNIDVVAAEGLTILWGNVPTWHLKQVAQTIVLTVPGVEEIRNSLSVGGST